MDNDKTRACQYDLIETCKEGTEGDTGAAEHAKRERDLETSLNEQRAGAWTFAEESRARADAARRAQKPTGSSFVVR